MAIYREDIADIELESGNVHRVFLKKSIGTGDIAANRFGVRLFRNGEAVNVGTSTVQGYFRDPQGNNIAITGSTYTGKDGNKAWVTLPAACYNYEGQFCLAIKLVNSTDGITGTMRIVDGMVDNTHTGGAVAPTENVPTYEEILDVYEEMLETLDAAVRYDTDQELSSAEQAQARENIDAASTNPATTSTNGLMSSSDKSKLNGIEAEATKTIINSTLTQAGQAADAKKTGDELSTHKTAIDKLAITEELTPDVITEGVLKTDGTIQTYSGLQLYKFNYLSQGVYLLEGVGTFETGNSYCYAWRVKNGVMVDYIAVATKPQEFFYYPIVIDTDADGIWMNPSLSIKLLKVNMDKKVDEISDLYPVPITSQATGILMTDGTITEYSTIQINKYTITPTKKYYINGEQAFDVGSGFCYVWFVEDGDMVEYIPVSTKPQVFDHYEVRMPEDTEEIWLCGNDIRLYEASAKDLTARNLLNSFGRQWQGKTWYAYGTSITANNEHGTLGKYPAYLAQMSGMTCVNKGWGGEGIGNFGAWSTGKVYDEICNVTDGKLNADIITLETGANDLKTGVTVPLGTVYDTGQSTLCGCLNDCIRYLLANTTAQIVIINSPYSSSYPTLADEVFEWRELMRRICYLNGVHFIDASCNTGSAKLASSQGSLYTIDGIHQTDLGGYIYAENIWYQLRNIPLFYTSMPT